MTYIDDSIAAVIASSADMDCLRTIRERASGLQLQASDELRALSLFPSKAASAGGSLVMPVRPCSDSLVILANDVWRWAGGDANEEDARLLLKVSRIEYARSVFSDLLFELAASKMDLPTRSKSLDPDEAIASIRAIDWTNADEISRLPRSQLWCSQSAGFNFYDWLSSTSPEQPERQAYECRDPALSCKVRPTVQAVMAAIAFTWLDEALANDARALSLMAEVGQALQECGFQQGWEGGLESAEEEVGCLATRLGQKGAAARHVVNRFEKQTVRAAYLAGSFKSKDEAASELAEKIVSAKWRTVRDWLKGV